MRTTLAEMVFFAYDRSDISTEARAILDRKARVLRDQPGVTLRVEGHADERGSTEYNLALGNRRAEAVRTYLTNLGIQPSRMQSTTFGESPVVPAQRLALISSRTATVPGSGMVWSSFSRRDSRR
jgi:peptidoglycan-associated lipoprotein